MSFNNNRKFIAGTVTTALVASAVVPAANAQEAQQEVVFSDVAITDTHGENIYKAVDLGLIRGYTDGTFKPYNELRRSDVIKILGRYVVEQEGFASLAEYLEANDNLSDVEAFADLPETTQDKETYSYSLVVKNAGIFTGNTTTNMVRPFETISRQEMATVLVRAFDLEDLEGVEADVTDLDEAFETHRENIKIISENGVTTQTEFNPQGVTYRGQFASFVVRTLELPDEEVLTSGISGFVTADDSSDVEGVVVSIGEQQTVTDQNGFYQLTNITPGEVDVTFTQEGYKTVVVEDRKITEDTVTTVNADLGAKIDTTAITIEGTIVNSDTGAAVDAADITIEAYDAENDDWTVVDTASTNSTGAYEIDSDSLELGAEYKMTVEKAGFKSIEQTITLDTQEVQNILAGIELDEIEELDLTVNVTDADEEAVDGAVVTLFDAEGNTVDTANTVEGESAFSELQLESGEYFLVIDDSTSAISYTELTVEEGTDQAVDVALEAGNAIDVEIGTEEVRDEFKTDGNVTVELLRGNTVVETLSTNDVSVAADAITTNFARVAPGEYTLRVSGDYIVTETLSSFTVDGDENVEGRVVTAGVVDVTTNDDAATINLLDAENNVVDTITGDGSFTGVAAGEYTVEVLSKDFVNASEEVTVTKNADSTLDLTLDTPDTTGDVSGFVRTAGTLAPAAATVVYYNNDGEEVAAETTVAGAYSLTDLEPGTYTVVVRGTGFETFTTTQTVVAGDNLERVNYNLTTGADASLTFSAVDSEGNEVSLEDAGLTLTDSFYDAEGTQGAAYGYWTATTDASTVEFADLSAGSYSFDIDFADGSDYVDTSATATIASGEEVEVEIVVDETASVHPINFRVIDEKNADVEDAKVVVFDANGAVKSVLNSDEELSLVNGEYTIAFYLDGYAVATRDLTVDGEEVTLPAVQLSPVK